MSHGKIQLLDAVGNGKEQLFRVNNNFFKHYHIFCEIFEAFVLIVTNTEA